MVSSEKGSEESAAGERVCILQKTIDKLLQATDGDK
jgi:hypothetical protein